MPITPFRDRIVQPGNAPPWLRDGTGGRLLYTFGSMIDARLERLVQGMMLRMPRADLPGGAVYQAPDDALAMIGAMRGPILRGPTESSASYARRLQLAPDLWKIWGSPRAVLQQVSCYFLPSPVTVKLVTDSGHWYTMTSDGTGTEFAYTTLPVSARPPAIVSNWSWDGNSRWWRAWLIVHVPVGFFTQYTYDGSAHYDSTAIYDGISTNAASDIYNIASYWLPQHVKTDTGSGIVRFGGIIFTYLQPTDSIPGFSGRHPFDPADTAITLSGGETSLPVGNWGNSIYTSGANIGLPTRPPWALFYNINNG